DTFTWHHVQYVIPISGGSERRLLDDVSGYVAPGKLTALMGESGAGKTTLNVLAQCVDVGIISGDRFINRQPLPSDFQAQTGYCRQTDTHLPQATIRETILSSAHLRQLEFFRLISFSVDKCLQMCGLEAYADAVMGLLNLACPQPRLLLFLDEPTSGLDSQSAWAIITFLRELADSGQAIFLCSHSELHQHSPTFRGAFDKILLRKGGQTVYFGDKSSTMLQYFERNGAPLCDEDANPAEYMLDVIGAGATASTSVDWHNVWRILPEAAVLEDELGRIHAEGRSLPVVQTELHTQYATSWKHQTIALAQRNFQAYWRNLIYGLVTVSCSHSVSSVGDIGFCLSLISSKAFSIKVCV
ncbi:P-loop containing nucleoside triphosphate hydrolase protein, partial [Suillus decipiens]